MTSQYDAGELHGLLVQIRDNQAQQLQMQAEALDYQRRNFALVQRQFDKAEKLQDRAVQIQESGAKLVAGARRALVFVLPVIVILLAYLSWLIFDIF